MRDFVTRLASVSQSVSTRVRRRIEASASIDCAAHSRIGRAQEANCAIAERFLVGGEERKAEPLFNVGARPKRPTCPLKALASRR